MYLSSYLPPFVTEKRNYRRLLLGLWSFCAKACVLPFQFRETLLRTIPTKASEALGRDGAQVEGEEKAGFVCVCVPSSVL